MTDETELKKRVELACREHGAKVVSDAAYAADGGHSDGGWHRHPRRSALPSIEVIGLAGAECAPQGNGATVHR